MRAQTTHARGWWRLALPWMLAGLAAGGTGGFYTARALAARLPAPGHSTAGIVVGGQVLQTPEPTGPLAQRLARRVLERSVSLTFEGREVLRAPAESLGAAIETSLLEHRLAQVGRRGAPLRRLSEVRATARGETQLPMELEVEAETLARQLDLYKDEHDRPPLAAKLDFNTGTAAGERPGRWLDVYGTAERLREALRDDRRTLEDPLRVEAARAEEPPLATAAFVTAIDTSAVVGSYETEFEYAGSQSGRAANIARAAEQLAGTVFLPGQELSFNATVGPRSLENGFKTAGEIYKGEMREGVGGGTCQVAGTLHAAAFFGGFDIVQRNNHSRPSSYLDPGLDATVVYPEVDLRLRNPYDFPVVTRVKLQPGKLRFELRGKVSPVRVTWSSQTLKRTVFTRKIVPAPWMQELTFKLKQKGIWGLKLLKTRKLLGLDGETREEVTTDVYPPTMEIYYLGPGVDAEADLPPIPDEPPPLD